MKITIIGGGNLGTSIAEGLMSSGFVAPTDITITRRNLDALQSLAAKGAQITSNNTAAVQGADWIVLAVKPFQAKEVLTEIEPVLHRSSQHLVSVVTGLWVDDIQSVLGNQMTIFRAMPNTAIAIRESMTCLCAVNATDAQKATAAAMFNTVGKTVFIDEKLMDAATVLGACGTAYAMRYIRANIQGGIEIGFSAATAALIAAQTVKGAAELLLQKNTHPEQEIDKVTTPRGCTIAGLNEMEHQGFSSSLIKGLVTSYNKIKNDM